MRVLRSLAMLASLIWVFFLLDVMVQSSSSRALDALLQDYAYRAFIRPRTGIPYDGAVPSNVTGIKIAAMRLRSGSLRTYGVKMYKEFRIPIGVTESPYVERLVLVYHNLGNWSNTYYQLSGYTYMAPVIGLLAYDAINLSATNLPELAIKASHDPISIIFQDMTPVPDGSVPQCVWFDLHGFPNFSNVISDNTCLTTQQGHFSIVIESLGPSPAPVSPLRPPSAGLTPSGKGKKSNSKVGIIVGSVVGGLALLALLFLVLWMQKYKHRKKMQQMQKAADVGEALQMTPIGDTKAPAAMVTRTQPVLEKEYVP